VTKKIFVKTSVFDVTGFTVPNKSNALFFKEIMLSPQIH
jgi:hypothetical protein